MDNAIKDLAEREERKSQFRQMTIENRRKEIRDHNNIWDQRRIEVKNKEFLITPQDYKTFVPKQRQINLELIEEVAVDPN